MTDLISINVQFVISTEQSTLSFDRAKRVEKSFNIMSRKELVVSALENGTVLDHIPAENV